VGTLIRPFYATQAHRLPNDCILVARARAVRRTPLIGTSKCPTRYLHPRMVRRLPFFSARGHRRPSNLAHPLPVKTQMREIRSGLYNKRHLVELSNVGTIGLSDGHWDLGLSECPTVPMSDTPTAPMSDCPTLGLSDSPTLGLSDSPTLGLSDSPTLGLSDSPTLGQSERPDHRTVRQSECPIFLIGGRLNI
jgi:hypothetical protein